MDTENEISLPVQWANLMINDALLIRTKQGIEFKALVVDTDNKEFVTLQQLNGHILEIEYFDMEDQYKIIGSILL